MKFYILSLKEMATCGQAGGGLPRCYSCEHGGPGWLRSASVQGIAMAEKLMQLLIELLEALSTVKVEDSPVIFCGGHTVLISLLSYQAVRRSS